MMKKCITSFLVIFVMAVGICIPASATEIDSKPLEDISAEVFSNPDADVEWVENRVYVNGVDITVNIEEEIERAKNHITDVEIDLDSVPGGIVFTKEAVTGEETACVMETYTTTREISLPDYGGDNKIYATTNVSVLASDKSDTSTETLYYVTATATIYWRDNLGIYNDFLGASGTWVAATDPSTGRKSTISNRKVKLRGIQFQSSTETKANDEPSINSFTIPASALDDGYWAYEIQTTATITSPSGDKDTLVCHASTGQIIIS